MINGNINNSLVRQVKGKVELYEGSTLLNTFTYTDRLKSFTVERVGEESKFFGFGICQKINVKLIDKDRELDISTANSFKAYLTTGEEYYSPFPTFNIIEVHRDENTNELSITAYDALYAASGIILDSQALKDQIKEEGEALTLALYANAVAISMGLPPKKISVGGIIVPFPPLGFTNFNEDVNPFGLEYPEGANLEGTENLREIADDIAEATQSIYYIDHTDCLIFKLLKRDDDADLTIGKVDYTDLNSKTNRRLVSIYHTTQLGDNVSDSEEDGEEENNLNKDVVASLEMSGTTQYVRDNAFWENRADIGALVENALAAIGGITINQFECSWRGNYLLEPGDKIDLITKDNDVVSSYLLNDSIEYNGALKQKTSWKYEDNQEETPSNPSTLGEALNRTYARVDKVNKEITMLASDVKANDGEIENLSKLILDPEGIQATVQSIQEATDEAIEQINDSLDTLTKSVELAMTDEAVEIKINEALSNGVDSVETTSGFTFNQDGLKVSSSDSDIYTLIDEDGMDISIGDDPEPVLAANNSGVNAMNLTARQFLIIGTNSRFEDYSNKTRTGCFWIGG